MTNNGSHTITTTVTDTATAEQYDRLLRTMKDARGTGTRLAVKMIDQFMRIVETDTDGTKLGIDVYPNGDVTDPFTV
jgi:hypothetical protein